MLIERLREVHASGHRNQPRRKAFAERSVSTLAGETTGSMSRHGHLSNAAAASVIEQLLPGKIERVVLGHLSRDCNTPELATAAVRSQMERVARADLEIFCALQDAISPRFHIGETLRGDFQPTFESALFNTAAL